MDRVCVCVFMSLGMTSHPSYLLCSCYSSILACRFSFQLTLVHFVFLSSFHPYLYFHLDSFCFSPSFFLSCFPCPTFSSPFSPPPHLRLPSSSRMKSAGRDGGAQCCLLSSRGQHMCLHFCVCVFYVLCVGGVQLCVIYDVCLWHWLQRVYSLQSGLQELLFITLSLLIFFMLSVAFPLSIFSLCPISSHVYTHTFPHTHEPSF